MRRSSVACYVALMLPSTLSAAGPEFFSLKVGTEWEYRTPDGQSTVRIVRHERAGEIMTSYLETRNAQGALVGGEHLALREDGLYRYSLNGQKIEPPVCVVKLPANKGDTWKVEARIGTATLKATCRSSEEEVTVPAGKYRAILVTSDDATAGDAPFTFKSWYAPGVGLVKQIITVNGRDTALELTRFQPAS